MASISKLKGFDVDLRLAQAYLIEATQAVTTIDATTAPGEADQRRRYLDASQRHHADVLAKIAGGKT